MTRHRLSKPNLATMVSIKSRSFDRAISDRKGQLPCSSLRRVPTFVADQNRTWLVLDPLPSAGPGFARD
jgi:hypothetical protein